MGDGARKTGELSNTVSGLTENEKNLIESTWRAFCSNNREYGLLLFLSLFVRHPEYLSMFRTFRAKHPPFRAHGCAIGYHLTSMVENILDPATLEVLVRRNTTAHLRRQGIRPRHFEVMGEIVIDVLQATEERLMTPAAVDAWKKFLSYMVLIIADVFDKAAAELDQNQTKYSTALAPTDSMDELALTVSSHATAKSREATTTHAGAKKLVSTPAPKVILPCRKLAGSSSSGAQDDLAAAGFGKSSSKKRHQQPDLHASDVDQGGGAQGTKTVTGSSRQAGKTCTTEKSTRNKGLRQR
ncbi:hypothetical protein MRX96_043595 [Rhipicephalus microplus]